MTPHYLAPGLPGVVMEDVQPGNALTPSHSVGAASAAATLHRQATSNTLCGMGVPPMFDDVRIVDLPTLLN